ncbi:MAG: hypothetical protein RLZZ192_896, partial [Pseudomonadota bacterium]
MTTTRFDSDHATLVVEFSQGAGKRRAQNFHSFPIRIGRDERSDITLNGLWVGRSHAEIRKTLAGFTLVDLGTLAGTTVNGERIAEYGPISEDDLIQVGAWSLRVKYGQDAVAAAPLVDHALVEKVVGRLRDVIDLRRKNWQGEADHVIRDECRELLKPLLPEFLVASDEVSQERFIDRVIADSVGLGPLEDLFDDPNITEIMVNRFDQVFVERHGLCEQSSVRFLNESSVRAVIDRIVSPLGRRIDEASPMVDAR